MLSGFSGRLLLSATACSNCGFQVGHGGSPLSGLVKIAIDAGDVTQHRCSAASRRADPRGDDRCHPTASERMSRVDTAWLRMDNDVNLMMIVGVWLLQPAIALRGAVRARRRQAAEVRRASARRWCSDAIGAPLGRRRRLRHPPPRRAREARARARARASARRCRRVCGELATTPLDPTRPLWQFHLIERYEGGSALIVRIHHCIGDGIALISVMMSITDGGSDPPPRKRAQRRRRRPTARLAVRRGDQAADRPRGQGDRHVRRAASRSSIEVLSQPAAAAAARSTMARTGDQVLGDVAALALMADDSPTLLKGKPSGSKVVAWSEPMPLDAGEGHRQGAQLLDQRRAAVLRGRRDRRLPARPGDDPDGQGDPRDGAGEPAPARPGLASSATASAWRRWCCRSASTTRSSASTRCARA